MAGSESTPSAQALAVKSVPLLPWPKTKLAVTLGGLEPSGSLNFRTRLLPVSPTYRFPELSSATPCGEHMPVALGAGLGELPLAQVLAVKLVPLLPWPKTRLAVTLGGLLLSGLLYSTTRLSPLSAT